MGYAAQQDPLTSEALESFRLPHRFPVPRFVAEIGCNHCGQVEIAKQLIVVAKTCGANVAKFQKRNPRELLTPEQYNMPYDNPNSYGRTYGEHREFLEFDLETHRMLKAYAEAHMIEYATSVWDLTSAYEIASLGPKYIKIPSACNNHISMLEFLRDQYEGDIHISVGMSTEAEIETAVEVFSSCPERIILYACTSGYPVDFQDVCLLEILRLIQKYQETGRVKAVGFSGHQNGIALDAMAALLGAAIIERHFTLDRAWKGSDHAASLEPSGFSRMTRDVKHLAAAWSFKPEELLSIELPQRAKLKYRPH
ncbi:MAG TPA: N-acetylneuraminate synthase family protein [Alphaproteobacteria bacterium]|nr:N-acetylneuraminate synthase family protein [Alphaproteobacteria bacterium]